MAMANAGFDGTVTEADYAYMWAVGGQDGVESAAAWKVTQGTGRQISCAAQSGRAFAKGVVSKDTAANLVSLSTPVNGGWFLIVRHIDWTANTSTVVALAGATTSTTTPTAPPTDYSLVTGMSTTPGATYDQPLSWAWVRSSDTTMVLFDLRRVPGSAADLTELATLGGPEGETKVVREGGATFVRTGGIWSQRLQATFASASARDTAYAKASAVYKLAGARVFRSDQGWVEEFFDTSKVAVAGFYPISGKLPTVIRTASAAVPFGTSRAIVTGWDTSVLADANIAYASGVFTVAQAGLYQVKVSIAPTNATAMSGSIYMHRNNSGTESLETRGFAATGQNPLSFSLDQPFQLAAADNIDFRVVATAANTGLAVPAINRVSLRYLGPA